MGLRHLLVAVVAAFIAGAALAADPYPNQSGAVGGADLKAAAEAMRATAGAGAKLPLVASGRRADVVYAVFAGAPEQTASILSTQRRILCSSGPGAAWTCAPQVFYRFTQGRLRQSFAYQTRGGVAEDVQMPFRIVGYFANCVGAQVQAKTGKPEVGAMAAIAEVVQEPKRVTVSVDAGDVYELTETPPGNDPERCEFTLQSVQRGKGVVLAAAPQGQESAPQPVAQAAPALAQAAEPPAPHAASGWLVNAAVAFNIIAAFAALVLPFVVRQVQGRRAAAKLSKLATAATVVGAIAAIVCIRLAGVPGTTRYLTFVLPLTIITAMSCVYWTVVGLMAAKRSDLERVAKERERRARANREAR